MSRTETYLGVLREEFPALRLVDKAESPFSRLLDLCLRAVTFGGQSVFQSRYVTTIGQTIYLPSNWDGRSDDDRYITLRHEAVHLRQFRRYGFFGMSLLYLFPILPMGLSLGRAWLEREAYRESIRATFEVHGLEAARALEPHIVRQFTGPAYGFMWPFPRWVRRWVYAALREVSFERT